MAPANEATNSPDDDLRPEYSLDYADARPNRFAKGTGHSTRVWPRAIICVQLVSLAAMVALSRADRRMLGDYNDLAMACLIPILIAQLFSLFVAPWIVIASAWKSEMHERRVAAILLLELGMILALLYAAVPVVQ